MSLGTYPVAIVGGAVVASLIVYAGNLGPVVQGVATTLPTGALLILYQYRDNIQGARDRLEVIAGVELGLMLGVASAALGLYHELPWFASAALLLVVYGLGVTAMLTKKR